MTAFAIRSPFCPVYERNKIFAFDFVYFIARECRSNWSPRNRSQYFIDPLSPMTSDIEDGARAFLRNHEHIFAEKYEALVPPGVSSHVGIFYKHAEQTFRLFFSRCGSPEEFFNSMVYVARLAILFYQRGVREAPDYAVVIIGESLWCFMQHAGPGVFPLFQVIGRDLARQT